MQKVVISKQREGFRLSAKAIVRYAELKGITIYPEEGDYCQTIYWTVPKQARPTVLSEPRGSNSVQAQQASGREYRQFSFSDRDIPRDNPQLVKVVEEMGEEAGCERGGIKIVEVPDDVEWAVYEDNGREWVAEKHRIWT